MSTPRNAWSLTIAAALAASQVLVAGSGTSSAASRSKPAIGRETRMGPVREIVLAVPFELERGYVHEWRSERPLVSRGTLLVLGVDPEYARARETAEPVLCVGDQTAERVNHGDASGRIVVIVPAHDGDDDPARAPIWFAPAELPERVDARWIAVARNSVDARPFEAAEVDAAHALGGAPLHFVDRTELDYHAGALVLAHSPSEVDLARRCMAPVTR